MQGLCVRAWGTTLSRPLFFQRWRWFVSKLLLLSHCEMEPSGKWLPAGRRRNSVSSYSGRNHTGWSQRCRKVCGFAVISGLLSQFAQRSVSAHLPSWQRFCCETKRWLGAWRSLPPPLWRSATSLTFPAVPTPAPPSVCSDTERAVLCSFSACWKYTAESESAFTVGFLWLLINTARCATSWAAWPRWTE